MGAWIGFMLATACSERFSSFILGGFSPYRDGKLLAMDREAAEGTRQLVLDPEAALRRRERAIGRPLTEDERNRLLGVDARSLAAVFGSMAAFNWFTPGQLASVAVPCLVYCGEVDPQHGGVKLSVDDMRTAIFVSLPGLDHVSAFARSDIMLPYIKEFLAKVSKT